MKVEFIKIFKIFEELEEAGECATLTISSRKGISSIKLLLESPSSLPTTASTPTTLPSASGMRRRHRGAAARARRRQRAADHQSALLEAPSSVPSPPAPGVTSDPAGHPLNILPSPSPTWPHWGVGQSHPWEGRLHHLLAVSTWMDHLLRHRCSCQGTLPPSALES